MYLLFYFRFSILFSTITINKPVLQQRTTTTAQHHKNMPCTEIRPPHTMCPNEWWLCEKPHVHCAFLALSPVQLVPTVVYTLSVCVVAAAHKRRPISSVCMRFNIPNESSTENNSVNKYNAFCVRVYHIHGILYPKFIVRKHSSACHSIITNIKPSSITRIQHIELKC